MVLDPLPPTGDEYWKGAETFKQEAREVKDCVHYFIHKSSSEVECRNCRIGFVLSPGWSVKDGKLVDPSGLVIGLVGSSIA